MSMIVFAKLADVRVVWGLARLADVGWCLAWQGRRMFDGVGLGKAGVYRLVWGLVRLADV